MKKSMGFKETLQAAREQERVFGANREFRRRYGKLLYLDLLVILIALCAMSYLNALFWALNWGLSVLAGLAVALVLPLLYLGILYACRHRSPTYGILRDWLTRRRFRSESQRSE